MKTVGTPTPYIDARRKVTGEAEFTDDIRVKNCLYVKFLRSPYAHARIISIDISEAEKVEGIKYIALGKEPPIPFGVIPVSQDETVMAIDKVRYIGEIVAAIAAETEEATEEALKKIHVGYQPLKPFFSYEESLDKIINGEQIHSHCKNGTNIHKTAELRFGNQKEGLENAKHRHKMSFEFEGLNHAFTEPQATIAYWDAEKNLTVISSTQVPHYLHKTLSKVLQIPLNKIRVIKPFVGSGFGGKSDPLPHEIITAYLAMKIGRPCKCKFSREEVFLTNHGRHPTKMEIEIGCDETGKFEALDSDILIDGGAYASYGVVTSYYNGVLLQGPYRVDNFGFRTRRIYTNKPPCGAMRGHGAVNPRFAMECLIDELAEKTGTDPCELRLKNLLLENTETVGKFRITSNGLKECIETVMKQSDWKNHYKKLPFGRGLGIACGFFISGSALPIIWNRYPQTVVHTKLDFDGRVVVYSGASDIGQGSDTILAMITAEVLGIDLDFVYVKSADTLLAPVDLGSYSSRVTFMAGNAAKSAAEKLKKKILDAIAKEKNISSDNFEMKNNSVLSKDGKLKLNWEEAVEIALAERGALVESGIYISPKLGGDFKGAGAGLSPSYSFGACVSEVEVDAETGEVNVKNVWGAHDCGKAINPLAVEGQLEGSWHMGMGQAMCEAMYFHEGLILNANILDYKIPTAKDIPDFHTNIIESVDTEGPFGAKECGEGALHPLVPSVANAIYDAVGVRITKLPISREDVLNGIKTKNILTSDVNH